MAHPPIPTTDANSETFVVPACGELSQATIRERWQDVNRLLHLSMMSGQQMQLDATLAKLCELAREMISFDLALGYFWNEQAETFDLRTCMGIDEKLRSRQSSGNMFNLWAVKHAQPMLFAGQSPA